MLHNLVPRVVFKSGGMRPVHEIAATGSKVRVFTSLPLQIQLTPSKGSVSRKTLGYIATTANSGFVGLSNVFWF